MQKNKLAGTKAGVVIPPHATAPGSAPAAKTAKAGSATTPDVRVIKKYPNRRLYDTETSTYITLAEVRQLVMKTATFVVRDAKSNEDLTRSILLQIILEEETGGAPMFTEAVLANIIRFYGNAMQSFMGAYLEKNVQSFMDLQVKNGRKVQRPESRNVGAVHERAVADDAGHDGYVRRAVEECLYADAGANAKAERADAHCVWSQSLRAIHKYRFRAHGRVARCPESSWVIVRSETIGYEPCYFAAPRRVTQTCTPRGFCEPGLPQGADRFRVDPHASQRRRLPDLQDF